jgi:hypothetical protein
MKTAVVENFALIKSNLEIVKLSWGMVLTGQTGLVAIIISKC